jgi:hypothetical protein
MTLMSLVKTGARHCGPGRLALALACALLGTACVSATAYRVHPAADADMACIKPPAPRDVLVGVALSGGGSRAALFGAAGLEALARVQAPRGGAVLEQVRYLSSVSGGSLAASYYATRRPPRETAVLTPSGELTEDYRAFFARYREVLTQDFESALIWRQILGFRWINSALAARSLTEVLEDRLLGEGTLEDLAQREAKGESPRLIINTTLYNNGRRLTFSTLPSEAWHYDFFESLQDSLLRQGKPHEISPQLRERWQTLVPLTPVDLGVSPCRTLLAAAVAGSASFPPLVGPITFRVGDQETYWHTGDGGLYENQGIESLLFVFLKQLQEGQARRALIIAFDSSFPFSVGYRRLSRRSDPFTLFTYDFSRIPSIMEERATAYQALFFRSLQLEGVFPDEQTLRVVLLRHTDAKWRDDLGDLPATCHHVIPPLRTPEDVVERIAEIPTRFWISSPCDRDLLAAAAVKVVAQRQQEILDLLEKAPALPRAAR